MRLKVFTRYVFYDFSPSQESVMSMVTTISIELDAEKNGYSFPRGKSEESDSDDSFDIDEFDDNNNGFSISKRMKNMKLMS